LLNSDSGAVSAPRCSHRVGERKRPRLVGLEWLRDALNGLRMRDRAALLIPHRRMIRVG
jgi:hypothetical protein